MVHVYVSSYWMLWVGGSAGVVIWTMYLGLVYTSTCMDDIGTSVQLAGDYTGHDADGDAGSHIHIEGVNLEASSKKASAETRARIKDNTRTAWTYLEIQIN
ncbi:hypothetical protein BGW36DRAFT_389527 [Talaromyces proteolyticus]|uniref:Uncharacterized protein n=1 Tax=Talaromyces proteolyticus TaxID=1131652 RepID=A0AAD4KFP5_9EURO|nr:uncharacterized protein BGW36DRAFT_389527 [Talaromyces proteolyticus]KAH8690885.1 hypothetical protein BGW36DRAFT_389527 [Talaromyces proteolyticus]